LRVSALESDLYGLTRDSPKMKGLRPAAGRQEKNSNLCNVDLATPLKQQIYDNFAPFYDTRLSGIRSLP
jgi:hypothetical protein